jgi:hypothetical protein
MISCYDQYFQLYFPNNSEISFSFIKQLSFSVNIFLEYEKQILIISLKHHDVTANAGVVGAGAGATKSRTGKPFMLFNLGKTPISEKKKLASLPLDGRYRILL